MYSFYHYLMLHDVGRAENCISLTFPALSLTQVVAVTIQCVVQAGTIAESL